MLIYNDILKYFTNLNLQYVLDLCKSLSTELFYSSVKSEEHQ